MDEELLSQKIVTCSKVMDVQSAKQFYSLGEISLLQTVKKAVVDIGVEIKEIACSDYRNSWLFKNVDIIDCEIKVSCASNLNLVGLQNWIGWTYETFRTLRTFWTCPSVWAYEDNTEWFD